MTFIIEQLEIDKCESLEQAWDFGAEIGEELYERCKTRGMHPAVVVLVFEALGGMMAEGMDDEEGAEAEVEAVEKPLSQNNFDIEGQRLRKGVGAKVSSMVELFEGQVENQELSMSMPNLDIDENNHEADEEGTTDATQILLGFIKGVVHQIGGIFEAAEDLESLSRD